MAALYAGSVVFGACLPNRWEVTVSGDPAAGAAGTVDPVTVRTLAELAGAFQGLRGSRSYADLDKAVNPNGNRKGRRVLPPATLNNVLHGRSVPRRETVDTFLTACGLDADAQQPWLAAWERVATAHLRRPAGAMRVRQARPRLLGVHASIQVSGTIGELPPYVPRDLDADLRASLTAASVDGGFVLLVGGSSAGKTRALFEAVKVVLPEWWLVKVDAVGPTVRELRSARPPRTVVWMDELQHYLNGRERLTSGDAFSLIGCGMVLVATLWPDEYLRRATPRAPNDESDPYADDRALLGLARVLDVPGDFSVAERQRAVELASDGRIQTALDTPDAGFTQVLAAGPQLIRQWQSAPPKDAFGKAVITAALDARRVGSAAPLTRAYLESAAPAYLNDRERATAPDDWLDQALAYACALLSGATSALSPVAGGMGRTIGYTVADYLHQYGRQVRRCEPIPDDVWLALVDHHASSDSLRLADNAERRLCIRRAESFFRCALAAGETVAGQPLARLLAGDGQVDEALAALRPSADAGEYGASRALAELLAEHGHIEELRSRADVGDWSAAEVYAKYLAEQGLIDELRARADDDGWPATDQLCYWLAANGHLEELRARAHAADLQPVDEETGDKYANEAAEWLAQGLAVAGRVAELRARTEDGDEDAAEMLAEVLADQGFPDDALVVLRAQVDGGNAYLERTLADLLAAQGHGEELLARADAGDAECARALAGLLAAQGDADTLRARAGRGDRPAAERLAGLLADQGHVDEAIAMLRARAEGHDRVSDYEMACLLARHGRVDELRHRADSGDACAAEELVKLLVAQRRVVELEAEVRAGTPTAARAFRAN
ncbi:hypothetical protein [Actinoplanes sp. NPDC051411]|uniref:hypothetical protein n=1 Tax=Actinoplanes sp. NPDC051411 TaxID=3155522 RepID=UPI00342C0C90